MTEQSLYTRWSMLIILCFMTVIYFLYSLGSILVPFFTAFIGAYVLNRPASWLSSRYFSRGIVSAFLVLSLIILLITIMLIALPYLQQQLFLLAGSIPRLIERLFQSIAPSLEYISQTYGTPSAAELKTQVISHLGDVLTWSVRVITNLLNNGMALANLLSLVILTPIIMFYLLRDWPKMIVKANSLLPLRWAPQVRDHIITLDQTLSSYGKGQMIICFILMILYATGLWAVGLKQGIIVGVLTGFMSFIPYIGMLIGYMTSLGISFANFTGWGPIALITLVFTIISFIEAHVLIPRFIGQKLGLHPVWIIFALLAAGTWLGFMGILLALPITATLGVFTRIAINRYMRTSFYQQNVKI